MCCDIDWFATILVQGLLLGSPRSSLVVHQAGAQIDR